MRQITDDEALAAIEAQGRSMPLEEMQAATSGHPLEFAQVHSFIRAAEEVLRNKYGLEQKDFILMLNWAAVSALAAIQKREEWAEGN